MNLKILVMAVCGAIATGAAADPHVFSIWASAPEQVLPGEVYTVEFWGSVESPLWDVPYAQSAISFFSISALGQGPVAAVSEVTMGSWWTFRDLGIIEGSDVRGVFGGQLALYGFWLNPNLNLSNPMFLFSIQVTAGDSGWITYTPGDPHPLGGIGFYPDINDGTSIDAPNHPDSVLQLLGVTTRVVPGPGVQAVVCVGLAGLARRRR